MVLYPLVRVVLKSRPIHSFLLFGSENYFIFFNWYIHFGLGFRVWGLYGTICEVLGNLWNSSEFPNDWSVYRLTMGEVWSDQRLTICRFIVRFELTKAV